MAINFDQVVKGAVEHAAPHRFWGRIASVDSSAIQIKGMSRRARIGDRVEIGRNNQTYGEIIAIHNDALIAMPESSMAGLSPGDRAYLKAPKGVRPCDGWIGKVLAPDGYFANGEPTPKGDRTMSLHATPPPVTERRGMGARLNTGLAPFDTFLPIVKGQRIGLFAGSGVGKSSLISALAKGVSADIVIVALIGERSREVRDFAESVIEKEGPDRTIIFASTCDDSAPAKRRGALSAIATAEYFRDLGLDVLLLFDSITRFADAHREIALTAGETPSLRAYPPSTFREIAALAERTGPGVAGGGDITAIFSVLVAGSDMNEPVADMVRSILDGHVTLDREIAERGRFPAINVRRSVSRSLPGAASAAENKLLAEGRELIAAYDDAAAMINAGLYAQGANEKIDRAIELRPDLETFMTERFLSCEESYQRLSGLLQQR